MRLSNLFRAVAATALIGRAAADGAAIVTALDKVDSETQDLGDKVRSWNGGLFGAFPIVTQSACVLAAIHDGTDTAEDSAALSDLEAISIATAVSTLATTVNGTMTALIDAHGKFAHLLQAPLVLLDLKAQKSASDKMSAAIIDKVPTGLQGIAQNLVAPIDASFDQAIAVYGLGNGI